MTPSASDLIHELIADLDHVASSLGPLGDEREEGWLNVAREDLAIAKLRASQLREVVHGAIGALELYGGSYGTGDDAVRDALAVLRRVRG